jgi:DUF1365 family protein
MDELVDVYVDLDEVPHLCGRLWTRARKGQESATFTYDEGWLKSPSPPVLKHLFPLYLTVLGVYSDAKILPLRVFRLLESHIRSHDEYAVYGPESFCHISYSWRM